MTERIEGTVTFLKANDKLSVTQLLDRLKKMNQQLTKNIELIEGKGADGLKVDDVTAIETEALKNMQDIHIAVNEYLIYKTRRTAYDALTDKTVIDLGTTK